jgi:Tfp pilus assembly protein PilN
MATLNLLNYPGLDRQRRRFHRRWTLAAGVATGSLVALLLLHWSDQFRLMLQQEQQRIKAQVNAQKLQRQAAEKSKLQQGQEHLQLQHLQQVAEQHKAWETLNRALQQEAGHGALQLLSLQLTSDRLELQGRAKDLNSMNQARERLSQVLPWVLSLNRAQFVADGRGSNPSEAMAERLAAVEFVWHAEWPALRARYEKSGAGLPMGSSEKAPP